MVRRRDLLLAAAAWPSPARMPAELHWLTIGETAALLRRRKVSPVELLGASLRRIAKWNESLNAFVTVREESAYEQARAAEKELAAGRWRGPLHGIPVGLKDLFDIAGVRTAAGSAQYVERVATEDAVVVAHLKAAGAILLGKLNMDEFAYNFTSETSIFGPSCNPWGREHSPGGSSGGSAIAVATGMCWAALGSDTGGSIRLPAALCGVTGFKPTYGRVDCRGVVPLAWSLDHVGPLCRTAMDAAAMMAILEGRRFVPPANATKPLRLGIPQGRWLDGADAEVRSAFASAAGHLKTLCRDLREVDFPFLAPSAQLPDLPDVYLTVIQAEAFAFHEEMARNHPDKYHPATLSSIRYGEAVRVGAYIRARREMERLRAEARHLFRDVDLLLTPTSFATAPLLGRPAPLTYLRNVAPWNLLGLPAISVPCGFSSAGLPIGLQIAGPPGGDALVLSVAHAYQKTTSWHTRRPPED